MVATIRFRLALVGMLVALAGLGWWWTARETNGMDAGPWMSLGGFGWFIGVWVVMMAAMMFPSVAPTVALYSKLSGRRSPLQPFVFAGGYLLTWAGAGAAAYLVAREAAPAFGGVLAWGRAGRWVTAAALLGAAVYELTPLKDVCLGKCRSPLGALLGSWRSGLRGALSMGTKNGAWCVGCCWALMLALFALGVMSLVWMAFVAALIAFEKLVPSQRFATWSTAAALLVLAVFVALAPDALPGLTITQPTEMGMP